MKHEEIRKYFWFNIREAKRLSTKFVIFNPSFRRRHTGASCSLFFYLLLKLCIFLPISVYVCNKEKVLISRRNGFNFF